VKRGRHLLVAAALLLAAGALARAVVRPRPSETPPADRAAPLPSAAGPAERAAPEAPPGRPAPALREDPPLPELPKQRGVALGLFAEDVAFSYGPLLQEIAGLGATHVALIVPLYQEHGGSTTLALHTRLSPSLAAVADAIRAARREGLEVTLFPIVRLSAPRAPGEWRGTLAPDDVDAWFGSYGDRLGELAGVAALTGATRLVVGSELSSLDGDEARWSALLSRIRRLFGGRLVYSSNWDHYREARLLDLVDEAGVTAYFELRAQDGPSDVAALETRWRALRAELEAWRAARPAQPFVFTEVGYRSRQGASATPWDESPGGTVDLEEQRRAFAAFRGAWAGAPALAGIYVWNWYGYGGPTSVSYTPRGKPAAEEVKALLEAL
jgi:hypothetical protein